MNPNFLKTKLLLLFIAGGSAFAVKVSPFIKASVGGAGAWTSAQKGNDLGLSSKNTRLTGSFHGGLHGGGDLYVTDPSRAVALTFGAEVGGMLATKRGARLGTSSGAAVPSDVVGEFHGSEGDLKVMLTPDAISSLNFSNVAPGISSSPYPDNTINEGDFSYSKYTLAGNPGVQINYTLNGGNATIDGTFTNGILTHLGINIPNGEERNLLATPLVQPDTTQDAHLVIVRLHPPSAGGAGGSLKFHSKGYWDVSARLGMKWHRVHLIAKLGYAHHGLKAYSLSSSGSWAGLKTRGVPCLLTGVGATFDLTPSWAVGATAQVHLGKFKVKGYSSGTPFTLKQRFRAVEGLMTLTYRFRP